MAEQIVTWMHYPADQELLSLVSPAHATRRDMGMKMLPVDGHGTVRKWMVRLQLNTAQLKPNTSQAEWYTRGVRGNLASELPKRKTKKSAKASS